GLAGAGLRAKRTKRVDTRQQLKQAETEKAERNGDRKPSDRREINGARKRRDTAAAAQVAGEQLRVGVGDKPRGGEQRQEHGNAKQKRGNVDLICRSRRTAPSPPLRLERSASASLPPAA